jgi:hypothetical protein
VIGWIPKGVGWTRAVARPGPPQSRTHEGSRHRSTRRLWRRTSEEILEPRGAVTGPSGAAFDQIMDDTVVAIWCERRTDRITAAFVFGSVADGRDRADSVTTKPPKCPRSLEFVSAFRRAPHPRHPPASCESCGTWHRI